MTPPSILHLIESLGEGYFVADAEGSIVEANDSSARILGYASVAALLAAPGVLRPLIDWDAVRTGGAAVKTRATLVMHDRQRTIEIVAVKFADGFAGLFRDLAERESLPNEILERNRELEAVRRLATDALLAENRAHLQRHLLQLCIDAVGAQGGTLYLYEQAKKRLRIAVQVGMDPVFAQAVDTIRLGEGFTGKVAVTRIPTLVDQLSTDPRTEFAAIRDLNLANFASYPLVARDRLLGVLNLFTLGESRFTANDVGLLAALAAQASLALDHVTRMEELVERNNELERFNRLAVDRELRMIELKKKIRELETQARLVKQA